MKSLTSSKQLGLRISLPLYLSEEDAVSVCKILRLINSLEKDALGGN